MHRRRRAAAKFTRASGDGAKIARLAAHFHAASSHSMRNGSGNIYLHRMGNVVDSVQAFRF